MSGNKYKITVCLTSVKLEPKQHESVLPTTILISTLHSLHQTIKVSKRFENRKKFLILKPDKGQGIVLINRDGYNNSLENLFNDTSKFQLLDHDPTIPNLSTVQSYLTLAAPVAEGGHIVPVRSVPRLLRVNRQSHEL